MSEPSVQETRLTSDAISVLVVDDPDSDRIDDRLDDDEFTVNATASVEDAAATLDDVDCLVLEYSTADRTKPASLERIRGRAPDLPIVLLVGGGDELAPAAEAVRSHRWTDYHERPSSDAGLDRLKHRVRTLVERRRLDALSQRSLASVELAQDAIAIVDPRDTVEFANRSFAMQFGYERDDLIGRSWDALFTDDCVEHLETAAIPTVNDGWRWTGTCTGRLKSGATVSVRVRLGGLEDGSLVFAVERIADAEDGRSEN